MTESNETPIGALHADGTEKPEATVLRNMAKFAAAASPYLKNPKPPEIVVVTSQAAQFSVMAELQLAAQQNAVRALAYGLHQPCSILAESQIDKLSSPKLVILPSAQALRESTWQALLAYVKSGGNLLVTGPVSRDEHWHPIDRLSPLGIKGHTEPLTSHTSEIHYHGIDSRFSIPLSFDQQQQQVLETLKFDEDGTLKRLPLGNGQLFWSAAPLELSNSPLATETFYNVVLNLLHVAPPFSAQVVAPPMAPNSPPPGTLIYRIDLQDSLLYVFESEFDHDTSFKLTDEATSAELSLRLPAQHAALAVIDKHTKKVVAKYGF
jgi:hypothetical protein